MLTHREESLQRDINRIRDYVQKMSHQAERALKDSLTSYLENNRQMAYGVILRDQYIDIKEMEIDRLCLEFLVRQDPVAGPLRFAYITIRINLEIERVGDYAESIARQVLKLYDNPYTELNDEIAEIANLSISMFHDSIKAFLDQDPELAKKSIEIEAAVDVLRSDFNRKIISLLSEHKIPAKSVDPLMTIVRKFERVSDQARNICQEALYLITGEYSKHPGADVFRILFVDENNSCQSQMAEAIASSFNLPRFIFRSAGIEPQPLDRSMVEFMKSKGIDLARVVPKAIHQIPNLDHYQVIVTLSEEALKAFPQRPRKVIFLNWPTQDPSKISDSQTVKTESYEKTYDFLKNQVKDLVNAIIDTDEESGGV